MIKASVSGTNISFMVLVLMSIFIFIIISFRVLKIIFISIICVINTNIGVICNIGNISFFLSKGANIGGGKQWRRSLELWALHLEVKIFLDLNLNIS